MKAININGLRGRRVCHCRLGIPRAVLECNCHSFPCGSEDTIVPWIWWFELRNVLIQGERRGRITERQTALFLRDVAHLRITIDQHPHEQRLLRLARHHSLTVCDAAYLELAQREALPLATLDEPLARAARAEGVPLIGAGP